MSTLRQSAQRTLHRAGLYDLFHRTRNRGRLTVAMFHRVLPPDDIRSQKSGPWNVSTVLFAECLAFFAAHYHVVALDDILAAVEERKPLPERPLLITFDDGWADNAQYALPFLSRFGMPAVVFMIAAAIDGDEIWSEALLRTWASGHLHAEVCTRLWVACTAGMVPCPGSWQSRSAVMALVSRLSLICHEVRGPLLAPVLNDHAPEPNAMLTRDQIDCLGRNRISIESHGLTHTPLKAAVDLQGELAGARAILSEMNVAGRAPVALSFPHGSYNNQVIDEARRAGYRLFFTSDAYLNETRSGVPPTAVFGRIPILPREISVDGRFNACRMANWLFLRPAASLGD